VNDPAPGGRVAVEPVHAGEEAETGRWTERLVLFLRAMAALSLLGALYHWALITGFLSGPAGDFVFNTLAWQTATIYFAVILPVAAVGLWLAAPWGAVVWLTAIVSTAAVEVLFPQVYGGRVWVVLLQAALLSAYLALAVLAARERPP
jgi:hypothetical protein